MARPMSTGYAINSLSALSAIPETTTWSSAAGRAILRTVNPLAVVAALRSGQPQNASTSATHRAPTPADHHGGQGSILSQVVRVSAPMWANSRSLTDSEMQKCQHLGCHFKHGETQAKIRHYWKTHALTCLSDDCLEEDIPGCRGSPHTLHVHLWREHGIAVPLEAWQKFLGMGLFQLKQAPGLSDQFIRGIQSFEAARHAKPKAAHSSKATNAGNIAKLHQQARHGINDTRNGTPHGTGHPIATESRYNHNGKRNGHSVSQQYTQQGMPQNPGRQQLIPQVLKTGITSPPRTARALSTSGMATWIR